MALRPLSVHDLAQAVLACVCAALRDAAEETEGQPGCPCRTCVVPGVPAFDSCEDPCSDEAGGQLSVNVLRIYPSTSFPEQDTQVRGLRGCMPPATTAAEMAVTLLRCAPMPDASGCPPSCEDLEQAARIAHVDMVTVYNALLCCLPTTAGARGRRFVLGPSRLVGPQGGCVGVEQRVTVALAGCAPCPPGESS